MHIEFSWISMPKGHGYELDSSVSRVRAVLPLKTHRVKELMFIKCVEAQVLPLAWWGSLERGFQLSVIRVI
ncbi:hypothetical protein TNCV_2750561 [Trichonephila clavipes]|nr:hypothetical protein TNCV_2750561 [Trichonephila clavipes]